MRTMLCMYNSACCNFCMYADVLTGVSFISNYKKCTKKQNDEDPRVYASMRQGFCARQHATELNLHRDAIY